MPNYEDVILLKQTRSIGACACYICPKCLQEIGRGIQHPCGSNVKNSCENALKLSGKLPEKDQEKVKVSTLKQKIEAQQSSSSDNIENRNELNLSTGGSKIKVVLNLPKKPKVEFTAKRLDNFQVHSRVSSNYMKKMTNFLRNAAGRKSVSVTYHKHASQKSKNIRTRLSGGCFFYFDAEGKSAKVKRPVIWADAQTLLEAVLDERDQIGNLNIKVMADLGQGFFKLSMSMFPEDSGASEDYDFEANNIFRLN